MSEARLAPTRLACKTRDEGPAFALAQSRERRLDVGHISERRHATRARTKLARGLRPPQKQLARDGKLLLVELQRSIFGVAEAMLVLGDATPEAGSLHHEVLLRKHIQGALDSALIELEHRITVALLIARIDQRVQGERVLIRRGDLLLDETADDAGFVRSELDVHGGQ